MTHHHAEPAQVVDAHSARKASTPSPKVIHEHIAGAKPYDSRVIMENYKGLPVSWPVKFCSVGNLRSLEDGSGLLFCIFTDSEVSRVTIYVRLAIAKNPKLKVVDQGHMCWLNGIIESVVYGEIQLYDGAELIIG